MFGSIDRRMNLIHCSLTETMGHFLFIPPVAFLLSHNENTWKPPLSVRTNPGQFINFCIPQASWTSHSPGRRCRWKVFASIIIRGSNSHKYSGLRIISRNIHLIVALVPTGIKTGVETSLPFKSRLPALALPFCQCRVNCNFGENIRRDGINYQKVAL